ncbi:hypothetical protein GCM10020000_22560 [Streptomyces olivoverticillatus]
MLSGLAVAVGALLFLGGFAWGAVLYKPYTVPTDSMAPTIAQGNRVLAQRIDGADVRRGDVVVFQDKVWGNLPMVKRVVGTDGDKVSCCDAKGRLTVNGQPIEEPYLEDGSRPASPTGFSATVPEGQLFLLGDHRSDSVDSRVHLADGGQGSVPRSAVRARVDATAWPMAGWGMLGLAALLRRPARRHLQPRPAALGGEVRPGRSSAHPGRCGVRAGGTAAGGAGRARRKGGDGRWMMRPSPGTGRRKAARVILLDPYDRVLLLHGYEPGDPSTTWWFTPGGGLEGDESWEEAARRELAEETGITEIELGPVLWTRTCSFPFDGSALGPGRALLPGPHGADADVDGRRDGPGTAQPGGAALVDLRGTARGP